MTGKRSSASSNIPARAQHPGQGDRGATGDQNEEIGRYARAKVGLQDRSV